MQIRELMTQPIHTIGVGQRVAAARRRMESFGLRHLIVLDGGAVVGIVSDRDLSLVEGVVGGGDEGPMLDDVMSDPAYTVPPDHDAADVFTTMARRRFGAVVIVEGAKAIGICTSTDAMRLLGEMLADPASTSSSDG